MWRRWGPHLHYLGVPEKPSLPKRTSSCKNIKSLHFFPFCGSFFLFLDPEPQNSLIPDPIRIRTKATPLRYRIEGILFALNTWQHVLAHATPLPLLDLIRTPHCPPFPLPYPIWVSSSLKGRRISMTASDPRPGRVAMHRGCEPDHFLS